VEHESLSFRIGDITHGIRVNSAFDPENLMGRNQVVVNPRKFGRSGIQEIIKHHLEIDAGRNYYLLMDDRRKYTMDGGMFIAARNASPQGKTEFLETLSKFILTARAWCIEEPSPLIVDNVIFTS